MGAYNGSSHGMTIVFDRFFNWSKAWFANSPIRVWPVDDVEAVAVSEESSGVLNFERSCHLLRKPFSSVWHFNLFEPLSTLPISSPSSGKSSESKEHSSSSVPKSLGPSKGLKDPVFSASWFHNCHQKKLWMKQALICKLKFKTSLKQSTIALFPPSLSQENTLDVGPIHDLTLWKCKTNANLWLGSYRACFYATTGLGEVSTGIEVSPSPVLPPRST